MQNTTLRMSLTGVVSRLIKALVEKKCKDAGSGSSLSMCDRDRAGGRLQTGKRRAGGFSLVEVVLSVGVISFAIIPIFALIPIGMNMFRSSIDSSVGTRICQQLVNEVQETDFNTLLTTPSATRYFDVDGQELSAPAGAIYQAKLWVHPQSLPGACAANPNQNLETVTVQIANNPGNYTLALDPVTNFWATQPGVSITTYSTVIAGYYNPTTSSTVIAGNNNPSGN
jgi:uncharacterized protein (TIGR02598 family)